MYIEEEEEEELVKICLHSSNVNNFCNNTNYIFFYSIWYLVNVKTYITSIYIFFCILTYLC